MKFEKDLSEQLQILNDISTIPLIKHINSVNKSHLMQRLSIHNCIKSGLVGVFCYYLLRYLLNIFLLILFV